MGSAEDAVKEKLLWNVKKEVRSGARTRGLAPLPRCPESGGVTVPTRAAACAPGGGGVRCRLCLPPLSAPGAAPLSRVKQAPWGLFASAVLRLPPCDGSNAGGIAVGGGVAAIAGEPELPIHCPDCSGEGAGSPRASGGFESEI